MMTILRTLSVLNREPKRILSAIVRRDIYTSAARRQPAAARRVRGDLRSARPNILAGGGIERVQDGVARSVLAGRQRENHVVHHYRRQRRNHVTRNPSWFEL